MGGTPEQSMDGASELSNSIRFTNDPPRERKPPYKVVLTTRSYLDSVNFLKCSKNYEYD